jgi:hypothetical protein
LHCEINDEIKYFKNVHLIFDFFNFFFKKSMPTQSEKSRESLLCLEEPEMSDKTGKINPERRSYQST